MLKRIFYLILLIVSCCCIDVFAETDDYKIESLLRKYNLVTLGEKENNIPSIYFDGIKNTKPGNINEFAHIDGAVLVNGDIFGYKTATRSINDLSKTNVASYVEGKLDQTYLGGEVEPDGFMNFGELYAYVMNEEEILLKNANILNDKDLIIDKNGIYTLMNTDEEKKEILIDDYSADSFYIINILDNYETDYYEIKIKAKSDPYYKTLSEVYNKEYSGNIIINYPNAKYIKMSGYYPHVVAPMADIESSLNGAPALVYGTLICNSFTGNGSGVFYHSPYNSDDDFVDETMDIYRYEYEDFKDDLYYGNYSIAEMLQNYSVVALGRNDYTGGKFKSLNYPKGSVDIFHIAGNFLVRGNLGTTNNSYPGFFNHTNSSVGIEYGYMRFDLESKFVNESYYGSAIAQKYYKKSWAGFTGGDSVNKIYAKNTNDSSNIVIKEDYINFERLYSSVVEQQKLIPTETVVKPDEKGFLYLSIGGNYLIEDISKVNTIFFDDFEQNENKVTSITIKNSGAMKLPIVFKNDDERYLSTNDYYGKKNATHKYESNGNSATQFGPDYYHGNIIWNVPNATNITLSYGAPFVGHLIAPNADVVTPELHFAGCFIVNSLETINGTEAHFYPLQIVPDYLKNPTGVLGESETIEVIPVGTPPVPEEPEVNEPEIENPEQEEPEEEEPKGDTSGSQIENPPTSADFVGLVILTFGISLVIFINLMKRMKKGI